MTQAERLTGEVLDLLLSEIEARYLISSKEHMIEKLNTMSDLEILQYYLVARLGILNDSVSFDIKKILIHN